MATVDFQKQLARQLKFLATSCEEYDQGNTDEAIRMATTLRVLFHTTRASTSLLTHLHLTRTKLLSTCEQIPTTAQFWPNLTNLTLSPPILYAEYIPKLDTAQTKRLVRFDTWWNREIVYLIRARNINITRKDLVLSAANTDGGAHIATALEAKYEYVLEGAGWSLTWTPDDGSPSTEVEFKNAHLAALRQISYEVLNSPSLSMSRTSR